MKCCICSEPIEENNGIYAPKVKSYHWFCIDCYKKTKYYKITTFESYIKETICKIEAKKNLDNLLSFIMSNIGIPDSRFYVKKEQINKGEFFTKQYPKWSTRFKISDKELLYMFDKMKDYLNKQIKNIDSSNKVHYALAIVYNSYPKYLDYKEKQKSAMNQCDKTESVSKISIEKSKDVIEDKIDYNDLLF